MVSVTVVIFEVLALIDAAASKTHRQTKGPNHIRLKTSLRTDKGLPSCSAVADTAFRVELP